MAQVLFRHLTKRYGDVVAVDDLNLEVQDTEFVVLLGPSGCGKTTTLRCLAGLESPSEGEIYIGDRLVNDLDPKDRNVAMVFQSYALYPHMTVYKNLAFPLQNAKVPKGEIQVRVNRTAKLLQIEDLLDRKPGQLSGGQRQRVALGRAIIREPQAFLMDEPLSNLDAKLRVRMRAELKKLQKDLGVTTLYVTHDQVEAMTMGQRIAVMNDGVMQCCAAPRDVYAHPANEFVAGFVGSPPINLFEGTLGEDGRLDMGDFQLTLSEERLEVAHEMGVTEVSLGIRPQDVQMVEEGSTHRNVIEADFYTTEPQGDIMILDLKVGDQLVKVVVSPNFEVEGLQKVWMRFPTRRIHLFDRKTGEALT